MLLERGIEKENEIETIKSNSNPNSKPKSNQNHNPTENHIEPDYVKDGRISRLLQEMLADLTSGLLTDHNLNFAPVSNILTILTS